MTDYTSVPDGVSLHFGEVIAIQLCAAALHLPEIDRLALIDSITAQLVHKKLCRPRADNSRAAEWAAGRTSLEVSP